MTIWQDYKTNNSGNMAAMLAVTASVVIAAVGAAIDISGVMGAKSQLQSQVDMAALNVALEHKSLTSAEKTNIDYQAVAYQSMLANGYEQGSPAPTVSQQGGLLTVSVTEPYDTYFGGILGKDSINITVNAQSNIGTIEKAEIVLVLDNTASMNLDGKMNALKTGAKNLVNAVRDSSTGTKIALVPFSRYVRLEPADYESETWLDVPAGYDTDRTIQQATHSCESIDYEETTIDKDGVPYTYMAEVCVGRTTTYQDEFSVVESRWEGCVGTRDEPYNKIDGSYVHKIPGLLNKIPYEVTGLDWDVDAWCPYRITPLTDDYVSLNSDLNNIYGIGQTYIPAGLMWGRRVLTQNGLFIGGESNASIRKIMVLMSDGRNTAEIETHSGAINAMTNPPYVAEKDEDEEAVVANQLTVELCEQFKAEGIEIFTIAFRIGDEPTEQVLQACASSPAHALMANDNSTLISSFESISVNLESDVRLVR